MSLSLSKIRNILIWTLGISFLLLAFLYGDFVMVGFSDFMFLSWTNQVKSLDIEATGGDITEFSVIVSNQENISMTYRLWFVDAWITNDSLAQKACLSTKQTEDFWTYVSGDISLFTLAPGGNITKTLSVQFPEFYSGMHYGCIMFYPATIDDSTINTLPRRGGFINALVHPTSVPVTVKAFPSNRVYQATNKANSWVLKIYDINKQLISTSPIFTLNSNGTGEALITSPASAYYAVFKGQSHLASYLIWVTLNWLWDDILDFTTGSNLHYTQNLNSAEDDGNQYQTAGDLKSSAGNYDSQINGNDIAILTANGFQESWIAVLDPRNLNGDTALNVSDISVIWVNFAKTDPFFADNQIFTW